MNETVNVPEYAVAEIAGAVKRTLETAFGRVRVRGEICELKRYASGHTYLAMKDESAKLRAIIWRGNASRIGLEPENGLEVIATGRITSYPERSEYQLIIERLEYAGEGALLAKIERLRKALAEEGLFEAGRKRALPLLPEVIGVVSSPQGVVIQDIRTTIARRFPRTIILWPVAVQGAGAAAQIAAAISGFSALPPDGPVPRPDVLIIARGGGSLEDLMAFNEEAVVRAAAASSIPLISAVGHETDTTLIDFVSDRRAPTPTAAAELAVPARVDLLADLAHTAARLAGALARTCHVQRLRLDRATASLPDLPALLGAARQRVDDRAERLVLALPNYVAAQHARLDRLGSRLLHPREVMAGKRHAVALVAHRLEVPLAARLREARMHLDGLSGRLETVSYNATLARGFALVTSTRGAALTSASAITPGQTVSIHFHDGAVPARALPVQGALDL